jgi:hypothetical protein
MKEIVGSAILLEDHHNVLDLWRKLRGGLQTEPWCNRQRQTQQHKKEKEPELHAV